MVCRPMMTLTVDLIGSIPPFDGTMAQLTPIPEFKDFCFETLFASETSGHVFELLPSTVTRYLASTVI